MVKKKSDKAPSEGPPPPIKEEEVNQEPPAQEPGPQEPEPPEQGPPEIDPYSVPDGGLTDKSIMGQFKNTNEAIGNLATNVGESLKKVQAQDIERTKKIEMQLRSLETSFTSFIDAFSGAADQPAAEQPPQQPAVQPPEVSQPPPPTKNRTLEERVGNMEDSMVKLIEFIKAGGGGGAPGAPGQPGQPGAADPLTQSLGPLAPLVTSALTPKDPYADLGRSLVNAQIAKLTNPEEDPLKQIGQAIVDDITKKGITNLLNPTADVYAKTYQEARAKEDAKRDAKGAPPE